MAFRSLRIFLPLGAKALETLPEIQQVLMGRPEQLTDAAFEQRLYLISKELEHRVTAASLDEFHIASFSHRTIVYKGLLVAPQLTQFYQDLKDPDFQAALAVFHQRYSTNTLSTWMLAQPFHTLAHNGEINTLMGNRNWMRGPRSRFAVTPLERTYQKTCPDYQPTWKRFDESG